MTMTIARNKPMAPPGGGPTAVKPSIALALDSAKKSPMGMLGDEADEPEGAEPSGEDDTDPSIVEAAGAVRAAFHGDDDAELAKTLKGFIKLCGDY